MMHVFQPTEPLGERRLSASRAIKTIALALLLMSCATVREIQGPALFAEIEPLPDTPYYQGGATSLPAARQFAKARTQAILNAANRQSRWRRASPPATLGTALAAQGLSLDVEGSTELFTVLGLGSAATPGGYRIYTNRLRQILLDEGARTIYCLVTATDPYFITSARVERLFGATNTAAEKRQRENNLRSHGVSESEISRLTKDMPENTGLLGELRHARGAAQAANKQLIMQRDLSAAQDDQVQHAKLDQALTRSQAAMAEAKHIDLKLSTYRAGLDMAGATLASGVRDVILVMSVELRQREPELAAATSTFALINSSLGATFHGFHAGDIRTVLGEVAKPAGDTGLVKGGLDEDEQALSNLAHALTNLNRTAARASEELAFIDAQFSASGFNGACDLPADHQTLLVTPPGAVMTLAAGETTTLMVTVGGGATPSAIALNDPDELLTIGAPATISSTVQRYEVKLTAKKEVAESVTVKVLITSDTTDRAVLKTIIITAEKRRR